MESFSRLPHQHRHRRNGRSDATVVAGVGGSLPPPVADPRRHPVGDAGKPHARRRAGKWLGRFLSPGILDIAVGISMLAMALWTLKPDKLAAEGEKIRDASVFVATLIAFFVAETGDKTQIATLALAAAYPSLLAVIAGTTCGMLLANAPVVFLGKAFADRLPLKAIHVGAAALFAVLGVLFIVRGWH